jgi:hypothetical protein
MSGGLKLLESDEFYLGSLLSLSRPSRVIGDPLKAEPFKLL